MEVVAAIGTIQTMYGIIKAIIRLQVLVVKHKEEVEGFAKFVGKIENQLKSQKVNLEQHSREETVPSKIADSLCELLKLLKESEHLLEELTTCRSIFTKTNASDRIRKLREKISETRVDVLWEMVNPDEQPQGSSVLAPYYPPDHDEIGWKAYRDRF